MHAEADAHAEAPPQPPVQRGDTLPPPIVDGIGSSLDSLPAAPHQAGPEGAGDVDRDTTREGASAALFEIPPADLASFTELIARFEARIDKAATGRKYRVLRGAWDDALSEVSRHPDRVDLVAVAERIVVALRTGCESAKVAVVDACLDCIHRLFEYGHLGAAGEATEIVLDERESTLDEIVAIVCSCLEVKEEEVYLRMVQTLLTAATSTKTGLHHGTLLAAVRTIYNIYLNAKMAGTRTTARVSLTQILNLVFARMEAETAEGSSRAADSPSGLPSPTPRIFRASLTREQSTESSGDGEAARRSGPGAEEGGDFSSVLQKDAYLIFRALCKLSAKDLAEDLLPESVGLRSKILSLELLRALVSGSGPAFRSGERFIYALRHYLAPSLLSNCMSSAMEVVDVSLDICDMLLRKETLRPLLKTEIGALFDTVLFRFLESPTAGSPRRRRALAVLNRLSSDRQTLADLFLNYDCDMDSPKIFERIVSVLAASAENPGATAASPTGHSVALSDTGMTPGQEEELRLSALSSIVHVVTSLRDWSKPIEDAKGDPLAALAHSLTGDDAPYVAEGAPPPDESEGDACAPVLQPSSSAESGASGSGADAAAADAVNPLAPSHSAASLPGATAGGGVLGTISEGSDRDTSRFEETLRAKRASEQGALLFNAKPRKGIEFLIENRRLERDAARVAQFLMRAERLDATMVGEYIGDGDAFCVSVMHAYTDLVEMGKLTFDNALRLYLSGFRLPGEAQKIDRIMEKFSSRYCECNPGIFANAETAFILAYSTIMLHTDAHNTMVRKKMTKEEFVRNNRGINDGGDLPHDVLGGLYDRITKTEFRLSPNLRDSAHEAATAAMAGSAVTSVALDQTERARRFKEESDKLMSQSKVLFANRRKTTEDYTYFSASNVYHARLMFEAAWCAVLAAVSVLLEKASPSDTTTVALCLEGFRNGIAIASTFGMVTTKDAFVSSLAKFTHLNSVSEMRAKNVECVRMILAIAAMEGNNLGEQWVVIVRAVSQVEQIRAVAAGNPRKFILPKMPLGSASSALGRSTSSGAGGAAPHRSRSGKGDATAASPSGGVKGVVGNGTASLMSGASAASSLFGSRRSSSLSNPGQGNGGGDPSSSASSGGKGGTSLDPNLTRIDSKAATVATLIDESEIERIFINSSHLSAAGVADFCAALCTVALEELSEKSGPRLFCLQKIVEMAYYNMESRTRIQWAKIWEQMGPFFATAMCHENRDVSMYSIDALRQLASKFLEKDELSNFSFQRSFLKPFEDCFSRATSVPVRELVLTCVSQIVLARAVNIKSGWKSVFAVLALAADDKNESIMNFGFQVVESIVRKYFGEIDDVFVDAVNGVAAYSRSQLSSLIALSAIDLLTEKCARSLAAGAAVVAARPVDRFGAPMAPPERVPAGGGAGRLDEEALRRTSSTPEGQFTADVEAHIGSWFPILTGLAAAVQDGRPNVRLAASKGLYKVLSDNGGRFAPGLWEIIFKGVLSPMFDDVRHLSAGGDRAEASAVAEWATSTGASSLRSLVDVTVQHLDVTRAILPDLLELMRSWIVQETEPVAREGMAGLVRLVKTAGDLMVAEDWQLIVDAVQVLFEQTMPHEILGPGRHAAGEGEEGDGGGASTDAAGPSAGEHELSDASPPASQRKIDFRVVRAKCVVQLLLIQLVQDAVVSFYLDLSTEHILALASAVERSYGFAHDFNANVELRFSLWRAGFMNQVPNLLKQETTGLTAYLRIVFWLYLDGAKDSEASAEPKLMALCSRVLQGFVQSCDEAQAKPEEQREVSALIPVVTFVVNGMMQMSNEQFEKHLPSMYDLLLNLVECADDRLVRSAVTNLLRARIGPMLRLPDADGGRAAAFTPNPQVPGRVRERVFLVRGATTPLERSVGTETQATLSKVSGVRSAFVNTDDGVARVFTSAPDELLVASIAGVAGVESVELAPASLLNV
jgi:brefeldin A-inhibited guanine nucleotide-exchange protein